MVARRYVVSGEHTRIGFDASADPRWFDRHSECDRRDVAAARRHADCDGSSVWLLLTPRCGTGRSGQDEERDQHDECRCGGSHGHSMIRDRRAGNPGRVASYDASYCAARSGLLTNGADNPRTADAPHTPVPGLAGTRSTGSWEPVVWARSIARATHGSTVNLAVKVAHASNGSRNLRRRDLQSTDGQYRSCSDLGIHNMFAGRQPHNHRSEPSVASTAHAPAARGLSRPGATRACSINSARGGLVFRPDRSCLCDHVQNGCEPATGYGDENHGLPGGSSC
jgi:hypothetical protein